MTAYSVVTLFVMPAMMSAANAVGGSPQQKLMVAATVEVFESQRSLTLAMSVPFVVMSIALVVIGAGLLRRRSWGRSAAVAWGWLGIAVLAGLVIANVWYVHPEMTRISMESYARHNVPIHHRPGVTQALALFAYALYLPYPIVLIAMLSTKRAREMFT